MILFILGFNQNLHLFFFFFFFDVKSALKILFIYIFFNTLKICTLSVLKFVLIHVEMASKKKKSVLITASILSIKQIDFVLLSTFNYLFFWSEY